MGISMEENESQSQDANTGESSAPQGDVAPIQQSQPQEAQAKETPFHEHPRFKELIEERKTYQEQMQAYQRQIQELQGQFKSFSEKKPDVNPFVAKLSEIDPAYGEWAKDMEKTKQEFAEMKAWKQEQAREQLVQQYTTSVDKLHEENKVPAEWREFVKSQIDALAMSNPSLGLKDLPKAYADVYGKISKLMEGTKRAERASYVQDKSKDAAVPASQPRGKVASGKADTAPKGRDELLASVVNSAMKQHRAGSNT